MTDLNRTALPSRTDGTVERPTPSSSAPAEPAWR